MKIRMKKMAKKIAVIAVAFAVALSLAISAQAKGRGNYWLAGTSKNDQMQMFYQEDSILLKGKAKKAASKAQLDGAKEVECPGILKIAGRCKVVFVSDGETVESSYQKWREVSCEYKNGDEMCFHSVNLKVENNKVTKIIFL